MISLIVSSKDKHTFNIFKENVKNTIGIAYEIIVEENYGGKKGLCEVYNDNASKAAYPYLCFVHEDILFTTNNWGLKVIELLCSDKTGVIGIAGSSVKTQNISPWWISNSHAHDVSQKYLRYNIFHQQNGSNNYEQEVNNPIHEIYSEVVTVDGVLMCCSKSVWINNKFDNLTFKGFHFYDIDFSINLFTRGYRNYVIYGINIQHNSKGNINLNWYENAKLFHGKWKSYLPVSIIKVNRKTQNELEYLAIKSFLFSLSSKKYFSFRMKITLWLKMHKYAAFRIDNLRVLWFILSTKWRRSKFL